MHLLVVEDNRTNLMVLEGILRNLPGCTVTACLDPLEALERAETVTFDLVLVDYLMPRLNGIELIGKLRARLNTRMCRSS